MTKTIRVLALAVVWMLGTLGAAQAQTPAAPDPQVDLSVSIGGQFQTRSFGSTTTFALFNELATITNAETVGSGVVFDINGGYRVWRHLSVGLGLSTFHETSNAALTGTLPNPLIFGQPATVTATASGVGQTDVAFSLLATWTQPVTDKFDVAVFLGPSLINVKQDIASATVPSNSQTLTTAVGTESKTTGKAGTAGVDLQYKFNRRYSAGVFLRYLGGEVDLPSVPKMKVGGTQVGAGIRLHF